MIVNGQKANQTNFNNAFVSRTTAQSVAGGKSFSDYIALGKLDVATTASIAQLSSAKSFVKMTGSTTTAIHGIAAGQNGHELVIYNASSAIVTLKHQSGTGTAVDRMKLNGAVDLAIAPDLCVFLKYDATLQRWIPTGGSAANATPSVVGTSSAAQAVTAAGGITANTTSILQTIYIIGDPAAVTVVATPQISAGAIEGQQMILIGTDNTKTVELADGNGLKLNGGVILGSSSMIQLYWDKTAALWREITRNGL